MMKPQKWFWFVLVCWMGCLLGCGLPYGDLPLANTQIPPVRMNTTEAPLATMLPSPSSSPTAVATASPSPVPTATPTVVPVDMSKAVLKIKDFPAGFQILDANALGQLGLLPETLSKPFEGIFRQASPVTSFAFANPEARSFEVVIGLVFYPLTIQEQGAFDRMLENPTPTIKNFSQGFGGQAQLLAEMGKFGNASIGWTFTSTSGQTQLKGEMVLIRRGNAVGLLLTMFQADQKPPAGAAVLAPLLDERIKLGLGY